jgi:hypothetical protein
LHFTLEWAKISKVSFCGVLTWLRSIVRSFLPNIFTALSSRNLRLRFKRFVSGYVLILMTALIPVLLFGTKYVLDLRTANKVHLEKENWKWQKRCAKKAALAVAKNWNPGLTLTQQKEAIYKVADAIYNDSPISNGSVTSRAIPGLDLKKSQITRGGSQVDPLRVSYNHDIEVPDKRITYIEKDQYKNRIWNRSYHGQNN